VTHIGTVAPVKTPAADDPEWLDQTEAAALLRVSRDVVRAATHAGILRVLPLGDRTLRYHRTQLLEDARYLGPAGAAARALAANTAARAWAQQPHSGDEAVTAAGLRAWFAAYPPPQER
jgi:hypothetical protein